MLCFLFSILSYLVGMSSLIYFFWVLEFGDRFAGGFTWNVLTRDVAVFLIFPLQHSILPRAFVKEKLSPYLHRPFYVLTSGLAMWAVLLLWEPFGPYLYKDVAPLVFNTMFYASLALIIVSTITLNHSQMFGLYHGYACWKQLPLPASGIMRKGIYGMIRHPLTSLLIVAVWAHESLSVGRLVLNCLLTAYSLLGTVLEEKSLIEDLGDEYLHYKRDVPGFIPVPWRFWR